MKRLLFIAAMLISSTAQSQLTTTNPDTVCYQTNTLSTYTIPSVGAGTYTWTIPTCATLVSGQGTTSISVNWSTCPAGLINNAVSVSFTNATGCVSTPVTLNVLIYQVTPTIVPIGPFCANDPCVALTATPIGGTWSGTGVTGNQFCPSTSNSLITYTYTNGGCTFTTTSNVQVNSIPVLTPIQHN